MKNKDEYEALIEQYMVQNKVLITCINSDRLQEISQFENPRNWIVNKHKNNAGNIKVCMTIRMTVQMTENDIN